MNLFHYTKLDALEKIVNPEELLFWASRYTNYDNGDCVWAENISKEVIKEILHVDEFPETLTLRPFIICFCKNGHSSYMWEHYADNHQGIQFVFDAKEIQIVADKYYDGKYHDNPDVLMDCIYVNNDKENIKAISKEIKESIDCLYDKMSWQTIGDKDGDLLVCQCWLKQLEYRDEEEVRYLIPKHDIMHVHCDGRQGKPVFKDKQDYGDVSVNDKHYCYVHFPHAALKGIRFGTNVKDDDREKAIANLENCGFTVEKDADLYRLRK